MCGATHRGFESHSLRVQCIAARLPVGALDDPTTVAQLHRARNNASYPGINLCCAPKPTGLAEVSVEERDGAGLRVLSRVLPIERKMQCAGVVLRLHGIALPLLLMRKRDDLVM